MSDLPVLSHEDLLYQWGCAGTHRHGGPRVHTHGLNIETLTIDPMQRHHHHDDRCSVPPIIKLMAVWTNSSLLRTIRVSGFQNKRD